MENQPGIDVEKIVFDENGEMNVLDTETLDEISGGTNSNEERLDDNGNCVGNCGCMPVLD